MSTDLDLTRPDVSVLRLIGVELRKAVDTQAGRWLLISIGVITLLWDLFWLGLPQEAHTVTAFLAAPAILQKPLLAILGVLLATSEWSQRTAMVTFTLVPKRGRTVLAKIAAALPRAETCLAALEDIAGGGPHLAGEALSLADLHALPMLAYFSEAAEGVALLDRHPRLRAWLELMQARPSVAATAPGR